VGVRRNHGGERPLTRRSTGRQKRGAFGSLRYRSGAGYLSVSGWGLGPFGCGVPVALVPGQVAKPAKLVSTKAVRICVRFGCFGNRWCW